MSAVVCNRMSETRTSVSSETVVVLMISGLWWSRCCSVYVVFALFLLVWLFASVQGMRFSAMLLPFLHAAGVSGTAHVRSLLTSPFLVARGGVQSQKRDTLKNLESGRGQSYTGAKKHGVCIRLYKESRRFCRPEFRDFWVRGGRARFPSFC